MTHEEILAVLRNRSLVTLRDARVLNREGKTDCVMSFLGIDRLPECCKFDHRQHDMSAYLGQIIREKTEVRKNFLYRRVFYFGADECDLYFADCPAGERLIPRWPLRVRAYQMVPNSDWWWNDQPFCVSVRIRRKSRWHHWSFMLGGETRG